MTIGQKIADENNLITVNYPAVLLRLCQCEGISNQDILDNTDYCAEPLVSAKGFIPFEQYIQMIRNLKMK